MAASMFSNFASADRRKKVVTYGKSSRLPAIASPAPASSEDAPSPDSPQNHTGTVNGSLKKPGGMLKASVSEGNARTGVGSSDIFDVPSDDESVRPSLKPSKRLPTKPRAPEEAVNLRDVKGGGPQQRSKPERVAQAPRKTEPTRAEGTTAKQLSDPVPLSRPVQPPLPPPAPSTAPQVRRGKTPQPTQIPKDVKKAEHTQKPKSVKKATSRATTPRPSALAAIKSQNIGKNAPQPLATKSLAKPVARDSDGLDVFDVPSSDEEAPLPIRKQLPKAPAGKGKDPAKPITASSDATYKDLIESDDSNTSKKRKRQGSVSSVSTVKPVVEQKREPSVPQRSRKYQKRDENVQTGPGSFQQPIVAPGPQAQAEVPTINKPRRTRIRTVPVLARPTNSKGQSSPALLNSMLVDHQQAVPVHNTEAPVGAALEDETMYEIQDPLTTPVRTFKSTASGSVTPRQKALFSSLLGESSSSNTPLPRISALQLTDRKPRSLLDALSRSTSDLTYSAQARKTRLIDTIKRAESSSEDEEDIEDSTSESEDELEKPPTNRPAIKQSEQSSSPEDVSSDDMDVDIEIAAETQTSQSSAGFGSRSRLTYAKSRSYLQEVNPEDALFLSMDLDENLGFDSQNKSNQSEDEEDPTSQVRAHHELKRRGQQTSFQWETEMSIDEISTKANNSVRRSAMMELCTKMENETFTGQLLDSSLTHQFFNNMSSNGEIIFDFSCAVAVAFILRTNPTFTVLEQIHRTGIVANLIKIASNNKDILKIAKDRKTNLSKISQESVVTFRTLVANSSLWSSKKPVTVSPQTVALKALDLLVLGLCQAGSTESILSSDEILKLVDIASDLDADQKSSMEGKEEVLSQELIVSILEATSAGTQKQPVWSATVLQRLANWLPIFFKNPAAAAASNKLAVKLCMNVTNNKPKACQSFSGPPFVQSLVSSIIEKFEVEHTCLNQDQRAEILESLILSLGAMINLAEYSDQSRSSVDDKKEMINTLVQIFLEGSERASQADSMEESHLSVAVGYLTVLLGNLCLNSTVREKVRAQLPGEQLGILIDKIKEFVRFHEHVDSKSKHFEGDEGQETWQNCTMRLMSVVQKLETANG